MLEMVIQGRGREDFARAMLGYRVVPIDAIAISRRADLDAS